MFMTVLRLSAARLAVAALFSLAPLGASPVAERFFSGQTPTPPDSQQPPQQPAPPSRQPSRSTLRFAMPRREYLCAGAVRITVFLETKAVRLTFNNQIYNLQQVAADSGTKYIAGSIVWSSTGDEGFLVDNTDPAHPKALAEQCQLQSSYPPMPSAAGSIKGQATFKNQAALPADGLLIVQLKDLTKDADDPAAVLAEERLPASGRKSPISFTLRYEAAQISAKGPFAVSASITGKGRLLFVLVRPVTIPDIANPGALSLALSRATSSAKTPPVPEAPPHF